MVHYLLCIIYNIYSLMMHCARSRKLSELVSSHHWPIRDEHGGHVTANHSSPGWCSPARRTASPCRRSRAWSRVQSPHRSLQNSGIWGKTENLFTTLKYYIYYLDIFNSKFKVSTGKARRETESVANFSQKVLKEFPCDKREVGESPRGTLKWNKNSILVQMWNRSP